ncbi:MAG TPA: hypothetical protein VI011_14435 [Asanoa sp.]
MHDLATRLDEAASTMDSAARTLARAGLSGDAFGAGLPGRLGEAGRGLHARWLTAAGDRSREAVVLAARLADTATALRSSTSGYAETDAAASRREP